VNEIKRRIRARVAAYRAWAAERTLKKKGRVVQYGDDCISHPLAFDVPLAEVEREVEGLLSEGFRVKWDEHDGRVYLATWEGDNEPDWSCVFAEEPSSEPCDPPTQVTRPKRRRR
jgi:hypothetical protein